MYLATFMLVEEWNVGLGIWLRKLVQGERWFQIFLSSSHRNVYGCSGSIMERHTTVYHLRERGRCWWFPGRAQTWCNCSWSRVIKTTRFILLLCNWIRLSGAKERRSICFIIVYEKHIQGILTLTFHPSLRWGSRQRTLRSWQFSTKFITRNLHTM